ncbi:hypothetical protein E2C01_036175 [Portunus trituberculatus]|uniref:Uncharacterized protein n=1 Tax=Portunus trituberculatus TaxID=210409 RepID=A0A5B7F807_PORTR|nr:hypothetical protein [Portunus trituberculatus]
MQPLVFIASIPSHFDVPPGPFHPSPATPSPSEPGKDPTAPQHPSVILEASNKWREQEKKKKTKNNELYTSSKVADSL